MNKIPRLPRQNRSIQTREKLIIAAIELFSQKGFHSTNSKEIAEKSGVAIGSFYAYFKDKKELFIEAYKYYASLIEKELSINADSSAQKLNPGEWKAVWKNYPTTGDNRKKLKAIITKLMEVHNYYPGFPREITVMRLLDPDIKEVIDDHEKKDIMSMTDFLRSIADDSRINDINIAATIIFRTLEVIIHETLTIVKSSDERERIITEMSDMLYRYLFGN